MSIAQTSTKPSDASADPWVDGSRASLGFSRALLVIASIALIAGGLLNSPGTFSPRHEADTSLLKSVVSALALGGRFPTPKGVEIRNLIFYGGAAMLLAVAAVRLATCNKRPRLSGDDLLDYRRRCSSPYFWWLLLLIAGALSSVFSHAPDIAYGQLTIHCMHLAWWWPLAALLTTRDARRLLGILTGALLTIAALALWYHDQRPAPRLSYPMGNELFLAACLLPGVFLAFGFALHPSPVEPDHAFPPPPSVGIRPDRGSDAAMRLWLSKLISVRCLIPTITASILLAAIYFTKSRSAIAGLAAGIAATIFYLLGRRARWFALLVFLLLGRLGWVWIEDLRVGGIMGERAHSIRARLNHEWPYAIALFIQKPVLGHGEGAYSLLAGQYARDDQLDEPNTISFDEWSWIKNAHNEFLELLADLGLVGATAFAAALFVPLWRALRYCDRLRDDPARQAARWLVICTAGALVALIVEESSDVAFRMPGLPPIFLTVWAALWALVRSEHVTVHTPIEAHRLSAAAPKLAGALALAAALFLGQRGVQDWRAARRQWTADRAAESNQYAEAVADADFAGDHLLDPFRRCTAQLSAIAARAAAFHQILADDPAPPTDAQMRQAERTGVRLGQLNQAAPRFLQIARIEAGLMLDMAQACHRRGELRYEHDFLARHLDARRRHRADEPFRFDAVHALWISAPGARTVERIDWLRGLLRGGEMPDGFEELAASLIPAPDLDAAMNDLLSIASADRPRPAETWQDRLSPETLRLAALLRAFSGGFAEAARFALDADALYQAAGPRLFSGRAAALHESVRYQFRADPTNNLDELLARLHQAAVVLSGPLPPEAILHGALGRTRAELLLAAGRESDARLQIDALPEAKNNPASRPTPLATSQPGQ